MSIIDKLNYIQTKLKAPKGNYNNFGKYKYRSAEDILEALKPLLHETKTAINVTEELLIIGDRYYIKSTASLKDAEGNTETATAFAREPQSKKGMDESQITGSTSSYAKKYALNNLLAIDDNKDSDYTNDFEPQSSNNSKKAASTKTNKTKPSNQSASNKITPAHLNALGKKLYGDEWEAKMNVIAEFYGVESLSVVREDQALLERIYGDLKSKVK